MPVLVNGSMTSRTVSEIVSRLHARAVVIGDGNERIALVVVDSCLMPKYLLDQAKELAAAKSGIRVDRIMISATHTHTAPSSMGALGTNADERYVPFLRQKLAEAIELAAERMVAAEVGWGYSYAPDYTALRRWIRRPDRIEIDPFGNPTVRANMHAARNLDDVVGPSGPEDPELSLIAFRTLNGIPIAVLANFSMHYFQSTGISSDYFGIFCDQFQNYLKDQADNAQPVVVLSHGCSGDIWRRDYWDPKAVAEGSIDEFAQGLFAVAREAYEAIEYSPDADVAMAESRLKMKYRVPDAQRLKWAQAIVSELDGRLPTTRPEIYAREQVLLHQLQDTEIVLQAIRVGDNAIVTTPTETYALTGLKLKLQSPSKNTMVIELANGGDGYIPPPEQHRLGGYNTWAARSAGLEETAEPRVVAEGLKLLEEVAEANRIEPRAVETTHSQALAALNPVAHWRLNELQGPVAKDAGPLRRDAFFDGNVAYFLPGPQDSETPVPAALNRCVHFAGGRLVSDWEDLERFSMAVSFWNGMPLNAREVAGWMMSQDHADGITDSGIHLGISGKGNRAGRLLLLVEGQQYFGSVKHQRWEWSSMVLTKGEGFVRVYTGNPTQPDINVRLNSAASVRLHGPVFFGGRSDNQSNWEGRLDEIAIFDRVLTQAEIFELLK